MSDERPDVRFAVVPLPNDDARSNEFARTMVPHPLVHQELPYDPQYTIYNRRLTAISMSNGSPDDSYWRLRRQVILRHTAELPIEVRGPDAERLLDLVFTRDITKTRVGRCTYQFACNYEGGMILDGVLVRLADDRFWYGQADGDLSPWLQAHARGMDVEITDPSVLEPPFGTTDALVDVPAVGDRLLEVGEPFGLRPVAVGGARRIEAGLLNAGSDFDEAITPFEAGLGSMVNLDKDDFIGKAALESANQRRRIWGMRVPEGVARLGMGLSKDGAPAGRVCSTAWSPLQACGVAIVRLDDPDLGPGTEVDVECRDGVTRPAEVCGLPMYDEDRKIPRGELVDVPELPERGEPPPAPTTETSIGPGSPP